VILISRIVSALILGLVGYQVGASSQVQRVVDDYIDVTLQIGALVLIGVITGFVVGGVLGKLIQRGLSDVDDSLRTRTGGELVVGAFGLLVGLIVAAIFGFIAVRPLEFAGTYLLLPMTLIIAYVFAELAAAKHVEILRLVGVRVGRGEALGKLLDSSVLIDGRIDAIVKAGFLEGELIVPVFVLEELQRIADTSEELRKARGRRGLEVVQKLRKARLVSTPGEDYPDIGAVDSKLVRLARDHGYAIVTTDVNLRKVAQAQQVRVLSVNELADAMKPDFVTGERFELKVVREGKEAGQGVGYLDDGTMVIVDRGSDSVGQEVQVEVASVLQSPTGKLIFTRMAEDQSAPATVEV
jgi:uncharacterized protein YacL